VFSGAHTYVSASWYTNKQGGSTWNYRNVQAAGILRFLDESGLRDLLTRLTLHFEGPDSPSLVKDMPESYMSSMMKAIVAFEIEVKSIEHVFKMSQNRDAASYKNIIHELSKGDADAQSVAATMEANQHNLKGNNKLP
jgi:transcriptional regulator